MKKPLYSPKTCPPRCHVIFLIAFIFSSPLLLRAQDRVIKIPSGGEQLLTGPEMTEAVKWVEPKRLGLPGKEELATILIREKTYHIKQTSAAVGDHLRLRGLVAGGGTAGTVPHGFNPLAPFASHEKLDEALAFFGGGGGGLRSKERLIVENCVFILDFTEGDFNKFDPKRSAIYVEGYNEVLVRNCVFFSKSSTRDPLRKTTASIYASDCQKVEVDNCYFEGRTIGWRGHINIWSCGPTSITNCELNGKGAAAGGIWVATGLGEGKIDYAHSDGDPSLVIYPPGPVLVENCWVHDQKAKENSDGIYIQSARPYLIRNCKVENWGPDDSLIDVGFRDTSKAWNGRFLSNHGGLGMIENCELAGGWIKDSVGLAGGLVFRNNLVKSSYLFFYAFDGGSFYCTGNRFDPMGKVLFTGKNDGIDGWTPGEGMFAKGGKGYFLNNHIRSASKPAAMYVAGNGSCPVKGNIISDYNRFDMTEAPVMGMEGKKESSTCYSLEQWRNELGQDKNSVVGAGSMENFKDIRPETLVLPGGLPMKFGETKPGLTGPVGVMDEKTLNTARETAARFKAEFDARNFQVNASELAVKSKTLQVEVVKRKYGDMGTQLNLNPVEPGQAISFAVGVAHAGRYQVETRSQRFARSGRYQLLIDDKPLGSSFEFSKMGDRTVHGSISLSPGEHVFTYTLLGKGETGGFGGTIDGISCIDADAVDLENARLESVKKRAVAAAAAKAKLDALTLKFPISALPVSGKASGHTSQANSKGSDYLLWQIPGKGSTLTFFVDVPQPGKYTVGITTLNQADKGVFQLQLDGKDCGLPAPLGGELSFGTHEFSSGKHLIGFKLAEPDRAVNVRLHLLKLVPAGAGRPDVSN